MVTGFVAIIIAYLLGSIPSAYIITRLRTGKDIRQLGGGNVGARNVFVDVGKVAGAAVAIFDVCKGAAAVAIAYRLLNVPLFDPEPFILAAGVAAIFGHIWSIYLKFTGGNGLATTIGVLTMVMPKELGIVLILTLLLILVTHNPILSVNMSLLTVLVSLWFLEGTEARFAFFIFSVIVALILVLHFLPDIRKDIAKAGNKENFLRELFRRRKG